MVWLLLCLPSGGRLHPLQLSSCEGLCRLGKLQQLMSGSAMQGGQLQRALFLRQRRQVLQLLMPVWDLALSLHGMAWMRPRLNVAATEAEASHGWLQEFIRIGYYVNNDYVDEELRENHPQPAKIDK